MDVSTTPNSSIKDVKNTLVKTADIGEGKNCLSSLYTEINLLNRKNAVNDVLILFNASGIGINDKGSKKGDKAEF